MIHETINLKEFFPTLKNDVYLTSYCPDNYLEFSSNRKRKCVLVLPGGGYVWLSDREAEPVALRFVGKDIASFVLKYSIADNIEFPTPFLEVFAALAYIRRKSDYYHVDENKISVCGFSAGGHLASCSSALSIHKEYADMLNISLDEMKINGCILGYPVISSTYGHMGSFEAISKGKQELKDRLSVDKMITKDYPKTFIWHTTFDTVVPLRNSLLLAQALEDNKIFFEMHIYPMLDHGQSLSDRSVYHESYISDEELAKMKHNTQWIDNAIHFIKEYI